jgi:hypothetical protein
MALVERIQAAVARTELLPFKVEIATEAQLDGVIQLRAASYGKHLPELGAKLREPEAADFAYGCEVFVATSKLDGSVLGTLRTHSNVMEPLPLESSITLPDRFDDSSMVETTRLCIKGSAQASLVRAALFKALHLYCVAQQVDWMLAAGRRPIDRTYDWLLFRDVAEKGTFFPMKHAGSLPHRVMYFSPGGANELWLTNQHSLHSFVFETIHPDLDISRAKALTNAPSLSPFYLESRNAVSATQGAMQ